jgi:hypothetical protein
MVAPRRQMNEEKLPNSTQNLTVKASLYVTTPSLPKFAAGCGYIVLYEYSAVKSQYEF